MTKPPFRGILYRAKKGGYRAKIYHQGRSIWLGCSRSPVDAAFLYDAAARTLHKQDAVLNFPDEQPPLPIKAKVARKLVQLGLLKMPPS